MAWERSKRAVAAVAGCWARTRRRVCTGADGSRCVRRGEGGTGLGCLHGHEAGMGVDSAAVLGSWATVGEISEECRPGRGRFHRGCYHDLPRKGAWGGDGSWLRQAMKR